MENLKSVALDVRFEGENGGPLWAILGGEIDFANSPELQARVQAAMKQHGASALVMNLSRVQFMDSSGLRVIIQVQRDLEGAGGSLVLFDPMPPVLRILELTGLDKHLQIADTVPQAEEMLSTSKE